MQRFGLVLLGCLSAFTFNSWAGSSPDTNHEAAQVNQQVAQHQAEVQRLQQDVSEQESAGQQAAEKLQQQDQSIAELRKQLKAAQAPKVSAPSH